jgi:hypothetical protein
MTNDKKSIRDKIDTLDAHVLDVLVQLEALRRELRDVQRSFSRANAESSSASLADSLKALRDAQERITAMTQESDSLGAAVRDLNAATTRVLRSLSSDPQS